MDEETIERIEKEAHILAKKYKAMHEYDYVFAAYVRGAEAEHSRITELLKEQIELVSTRETEQDVMAADTVRLMDQIEYQKKVLKEDYDKIAKLEFELKDERNKVIDEIKKHIGYRSYDVDGMPVVIEVQKLQQYLTSLKGKQQ